MIIALYKSTFTIPYHTIPYHTILLLLGVQGRPLTQNGEDGVVSSSGGRRQLGGESLGVEERRKNVALEVDRHRFVVELSLAPDDRVVEQREVGHVELAVEL